MVLGSVRIRSREADSKLRLRARLDGLVLDDLRLPTRALALQVSDDVEAAPLFCARIAPERFRASRNVLTFRDRRGEVAEAKGLATVRIRRTPADRLKLSVSGKRAAFLARGSTEVRITVAVHDLGQPAIPPQCVSAIEPVRPTTGGGIRFP